MRRRVQEYEEHGAGDQEHDEGSTHHELRAPRPDTAAGGATRAAPPDGEGVDLVPHDSEDGRQEGQGGGYGAEDHEDAGDPDRAHKHVREEQEAHETNKHGRTGEEDA